MGDVSPSTAPHAAAASALLVTWLRDCPKAVAVLLAIPGALDGIAAIVANRCVRCLDVFALMAAHRRCEAQRTAPLSNVSPKRRKRRPQCDDFAAGLASILLGQCLLCGDDVQVRYMVENAPKGGVCAAWRGAEQAWTGTTTSRQIILSQTTTVVRDAIVSRVGLAQYIVSLAALRGSAFLAKTSGVRRMLGLYAFYFKCAPPYA